MKEQQEEFRDIPGFEGLYQVSNLGNVKSLARDMLRSGKYLYTSKDKILNPGIDSKGYHLVGLSINKNRKTRNIHQLVAITFLNHKPDGYKLVVDHLNNIKSDNRLENLQLITARENSSKDTSGSSKYVGVCWAKKNSKWMSNIYINGKVKHLGYFKTELEAHEAYQNKLSEIKLN